MRPVRIKMIVSIIFILVNEINERDKLLRLIKEQRQLPAGNLLNVAHTVS